MAKQIHLIYLPGFGDNRDNLRLWALQRWHYRDVSVEMVPMNWTNNATLEQKTAAIDRAIDRAGDKHIVLVGESAGGSMVIHMMARRDDIDAAVTVCGKNSYPETVGEHYLGRSPAFRTLMERLDESLNKLTPKQRKRIVSVTPIYDELVPIREMLPDRVKRKRVFSIGHVLTIALILTIYSPIIIRVARKIIK